MISYTTLCKYGKPVRITLFFKKRGEESGWGLRVRGFFYHFSFLCLGVVFNKTSQIIPLAVVGYEMMIAN